MLLGRGWGTFQSDIPEQTLACIEDF
jgi:hypothetical protein